MITTYVLHGGETSRPDIRNDRFFGRFTQLVDKQSARILMCYFAKDPDTWNERLELDRDRIARQSSKDFSLSIATSPEHLMAQLDDHDALYVAGGNAEPLESYLPQLQGLDEKLRGKVYIGCSMGAFIAAKRYVLTFSDEEPATVHRGLGLLPLSVLCHWDKEPEQQAKVALLKNAGANEPILTLDECESVLCFS